ncbi:hypothetical protein TIFTF001_036081 [Ficus carica]|uniref:Uncharacterized protein n=1 Tax=Ficus carica TaxID=3494 RepID=A0AA88E3L5_FICCA|nr:hypothetical protein TIFTF001_036069 [Ficus carica]GMN67016.1 hypothetical protein TIFTF001_036081 [Ficus carica]
MCQLSISSYPPPNANRKKKTKKQKTNKQTNKKKKKKNKERKERTSSVLSFCFIFLFFVGQEKKMSEESKSRGVTGDPESQYYGTFQGVANSYHPPPQLPPPHPVLGFPQPSPPPGATGHPRYPHLHYQHAYQTVPGYAVVEGHPVREDRLPCCGLGMGWFLACLGGHLETEFWRLGWRRSFEIWVGNV